MGVTPRYRSIADELRDVIIEERSLLGVLLVGGARMPPETALGTHFEASRGTIREALRELAAEGLIETRGRSGTFVRRLRVHVHSVQREHPDRKGSADTWFSEVTANGRTPTQDFAFRIVPADPSVARRLHIAENDLVVVRECTRYIDETPWSEQVSFYDYEVAKQCGLDVPHDIPEGTVQRMASRGVREVGWYAETSSRPANEEEERLFSLGTGVSVLVYRKVGWTDTKPVRYTQETLPADRNVLSFASGDLTAMRRANEDRS